MMDDSFTWAPDLIMNAIRRIFSLLDFVAYGLLQLVYRLFFSVASSDIFASDTIMKFYSRIQIILGVFMLFQLALIILKGIVNPDSFTDSKSGIGNLIMRICVALFLLTALVPISIPSPQNEYEIQLNNNGLLFGTLYSLQHRILENNTLGRLILGTNDESESNISVASQSDSLKKASRIFATTILKGFYRINLVPEENRTDKCKKAEDPAIYNECRMCQSGIDDYIDTYKKADASPDIIIGMVNETCTSDADLLTKFANFVAGTNRYIFTYTPVLSTITAVVFIFIFISFTIDVAVRAIKLAILRLIAPIPIISYMDPKGSKDSAFNAWVKTLTSTYLDLFVRLAIVYFVLFLIQRIIQDGIVVGGTGIIKIFSYIAIFIGMFVFAKQAPKFIRQALGLKDGDFKLFGGMGAIVSAAGAVGSARAGYRASLMADQTRESFGENVNPNSNLNKAKHILAGIAGGVTGMDAGITAAAGAKDHSTRSAMEAMRKHNTSALSRGNDGSTLFGRLGSTASGMFLGEGQATAIERDINTNKGRIDALKALQSRVKGEMVKSDYTSGKLGITGSDGRSARANYKDFMSRLEGARARGLSSFEYKNLTTGAMESIDIEVAEKQKGFLMKNNEDNYIKRMIGGYTPSAADIADGDNASFYTVDTVNTTEKQDGRLTTLLHSANVLGGSSEFTRKPDGTIEKGDNKAIKDRDSIWNAIEGFEDYNTQLNQKNAINKANDSYSGKKS